MVFMAQKVKMCPPKYTKYKIDLTGQYTWKFENTPGQYGLIRETWKHLIIPGNVLEYLEIT